MAENEQINQLLAVAGQAKSRPPIEQWNPDLSGDIDIVIKANGQWFHEGEVIARKQLVNLFSRILRKERDGHHYLVTPVEKWRIQVEQLPLLVNAIQVMNEGRADQQIFCQLNTDESVLLGPDHPLTLDATLNPSGEPIPKLILKHGLEAKVSHHVYYQLIEIGYSREAANLRELYINSDGLEFMIGSY